MHCQSGLDGGLTCTRVWASRESPGKGAAVGATGWAQAGGRAEGGSQGQKLEVITSTAPPIGEETKAQRGNSSAQGHTADGERPGLQPPGFFFPRHSSWASAPRNAEHRDPVHFETEGDYKNKTRAGCASLLVHFASFQLKGESQAWLFIIITQICKVLF